MPELTMQGTARRTFLDSVRSLWVYSIDIVDSVDLVEMAGTRAKFDSVWTATPERLAWVEFGHHRLRLPDEMFDFAAEVEEKLAKEWGVDDPFEEPVHMRLAKVGAVYHVVIPPRRERY